MNGCKVCGKPVRTSANIYCSHACRWKGQVSAPEYTIDLGQGLIADKCRKAREMRVSGYMHRDIAEASGCSITIIRKYLDPDYIPHVEIEREKISCSGCGTELLRCPSAIRKVNYCSKECELKKSEAEGRRIRCQCVICGDVFYVSRSSFKDVAGRGSYCSNKCKYQAHRTRDKICPVCKRAYRGKRQFCSDKCLNLSRVNFAAPFEGNCEYCGKYFKRHFYPAGHAPRYCSGVCSARVHSPWQNGDAHPNWKGGVTPEKRKVRASPEYKEWREAVFSRDDWTCQDCGNRGGDIHSHHVFEFAEFPEHRFALWNGVTLCPYCHMKAHGYEQAAKKYFGCV